jgi:hypothetical protein
VGPKPSGFSLRPAPPIATALPTGPCCSVSTLIIPLLLILPSPVSSLLPGCLQRGESGLAALPCRFFLLSPLFQPYCAHCGHFRWYRWLQLLSGFKMSLLEAEKGDLQMDSHTPSVNRSRKWALLGPISGSMTQNRLKMTDLDEKFQICLYFMTFCQTFYKF